MIKKVKTSDDFWYFKIEALDSYFRFNEENLSNVTCVLYDSAGTQIASYSKTGNTLVPVVLSYSSTGKKLSSANTDTDTFEIKSTSTSTTGKATGSVSCVITLIYSNTDFPDETFDLIIPEYATEFYLID